MASMSSVPITTATAATQTRVSKVCAPCSRWRANSVEKKNQFQSKCINILLPTVVHGYIHYTETYKILIVLP
jgi:hypothetical protein